MSKWQSINQGVGAPLGFVTHAVSCGIKNPQSDRLDLALMVSEFPCVSAGTFTTNQVQAAPVRLSKAHLKKNTLRAIVVNSGNANACTGQQGMADAKKMTRMVAKALSIQPQEVGVCSTGVIGLPMPMMRIEPKISELVEGLSSSNGSAVAQAIMTSDTRPKEMAIEFEIDGRKVRIGACVKGAGMISPCMATMLCFVTTDVVIEPSLFQELLLEGVQRSFNRITIDGDMSTNDTVLALANGAAQNHVITKQHAEFELFREALHHVLLYLAQAVVKDGERVTKFVTVKVKHARNVKDAQCVAEAVCKSALVKSSWNGGDPNWGRIIHAVGYSQARIREEKIAIFINGLAACIGGLQAVTEMQRLRDEVAKPEFEIVVDLNLGEASYEMYSSDLSPEYVDFNRSEYAYWKQARKDGLA